MRLPADQLRRRLGLRAWRVWLRMLDAAEFDGVCPLTLDQLRGRRTTRRQLKRILAKLTQARLVSSGKGRYALRCVEGIVRGDSVDVPLETAAWVQAAPRRGRPVKTASDEPDVPLERGTEPPKKGGSIASEKEGSIETIPEAGEMTREKDKDGSIEMHGSELNGPPISGGASEKPSGARSSTHRLTRDDHKSEVPRLFSSLRSQNNLAPGGSSPQDACPTGGAAAPPDPPAGPVVRSVEDVLALPFVPKLRLPDGKQAKLGVQLPWAPEADTTLPDKVVCERVAQLWCEVHEVVFGRPDHRLRNAGKKGAKKQRELVVAWWEACALKQVRPAEWMLWALEGWRTTHGTQKKAQPTGILSASRVLDGKKRRMFRLTGRELGGAIQYDEVGEALMKRVMLLHRRLELLVVRNDGLVSDDDVREIVAGVFPRGVDNAAQILADVHQKCMSESMDLLRRAKLGSFVWPTEQ